MLIVLTSDYIESSFICFFILYRHGSETLSLFMAGPESRLEATRFIKKSVYISEAEIAEENSGTTSFGENGLFSCGHICFGKQLLPQINICCREVKQNNKAISLMGQPLLDACSI